MSENGRTALVTGGSRGIGKAIALELAGRFPRVAIFYAGREDAARETVAELEQKGVKALALMCDVSDERAVKEAVARVRETLGPVGALVSNAGITHPNMMRTIREGQDFDGILQMYDVNAVGALRVMEAFLPLLDQGSFKRLCFVSSEAGSIARSYRTSWFGYCMSKSALNMAVSILFNDLRPAGYTFRVYHPGWVRSYMSGKKNMEADLEPEEAAACALPIFLNPRSDEDRLVLVDYKNEEWPW